MSANKLQLLALGFDERAVEHALASCTDLDAAIELLLAKTGDSVSSSTVDSSDGVKVVVLEVSQYSFIDGGLGGASCCTSICLEVLSSLLPSFSSSLGGAEVNNEQSLTSCLFDGVAMHAHLLAAARSSSSSSVVEHMGVDDVMSDLVAMDHSICRRIRKVESAACQGLLAPTVWRDTVFKLAVESVKTSFPSARHVGIVITKPPETVCVIVPIDRGGDNTQCLLFDSHPRGYCSSVSRDLRGAYTILSSCEDIITHLNFIFSPMPGTAFSVVESMYNMYDCAFFVEASASVATAGGEEFMSVRGDYIIVDSSAPQDTTPPTTKKQYYL